MPAVSWPLASNTNQYFRIMKQKIAGVDRPYTFREIGKFVYSFLEKEDWHFANLDYALIRNDDEPIKSEEFVVYAYTTFGSNEGIYTDIIFRDFWTHKQTSLLCMKTLGTSEQDYLNMSILGARLSHRLIKFVDANIEQFMWPDE